MTNHFCNYDALDLLTKCHNLKKKTRIVLYTAKLSWIKDKFLGEKGLRIVYSTNKRHMTCTVALKGLTRKLFPSEIPFNFRVVRPWWKIMVEMWSWQHAMIFWGIVCYRLDNAWWKIMVRCGRGNMQWFFGALSATDWTMRCTEELVQRLGRLHTMAQWPWQLCQWVAVLSLPILLKPRMNLSGTGIPSSKKVDWLINWLMKTCWAY